MPEDRPVGWDAARREVRWRLHLSSPPERVFEMLATDDGRARFWAESAVETDGVIAFRFPDGTPYYSG